MKIGVLALQGAFAEHIAALKKLEVDACAVRLPQELKSLEGLIIPGGESTSISLLMKNYALTSGIKGRAAQGLPIMGTCAGMILLAQGLADPMVESLGLMNITVKRNAFGRQLQSFEAELDIPVLGKPHFHAVFIRAPLIAATDGGVEVLARLPDGSAVAARQGNMVVAAFHPELTGDLRFHRYFIEIVRDSKR